MSAAQRPIGIFDSGLAGSTVMTAVNDRLPGENIVYFGDTARIPYGSRSHETIERYSLQILEFLLHRDVKMVVVACNSASAHALQAIRQQSPVPVLGVIRPGVSGLLRNHPEVSRAAVICTRATANSGRYQASLAEMKKDVELTAQACPLFVPLIEEGYLHGDIIERMIREYCQPLVDAGIRHIILGCTHYPLIKEAITDVYPELTLIDSSIEMAMALEESLRDDELLNNGEKGDVHLYFSDITQAFQQTKNLFLKRDLGEPHKVNLDD